MLVSATCVLFWQQLLRALGCESMLVDHSFAATRSEVQTEHTNTQVRVKEAKVYLTSSSCKGEAGDRGTGRQHRQPLHFDRSRLLSAVVAVAGPSISISCIVAAILAAAPPLHSPNRSPNHLRTKLFQALASRIFIADPCIQSLDWIAHATSFLQPRAPRDADLPRCFSLRTWTAR